MYPNGPAHLGHARTYVIPDILARFKRALGYNVLFPMGFHYTGTPILATAEKIASGDPEYLAKLSRAFSIPVDVLRKLTEPLKLARYFHETSKEAMKFYGLSIDWRREFTTVDPEFNAFIRWQFTKLLKRGFIKKGTHPVGWCPYHSMPVGMHDTEGDVEPEIEEVTLIKFPITEGRLAGKYLPVVTLRPETILGVTNIWVNPEVDYVVIEVSLEGGKEEWVVAKEAARRLSYQLRLRVLKDVRVEEIKERAVTNPITGEVVPILEATFVTPKFGTGVVMSVPSHAPYDYAALKDYVGSADLSRWPEGLRPKPLITVEGYSDNPAIDVVERMGIKSQKQADLLDRATKEVYRVEHERGIVREDVIERVVKEVIPGVREFLSKEIIRRPVREAREVIKSYLIKKGYGLGIYELMNAPVKCRCGTEIVVKVLEDQWFIDYSKSEWKSLAKKALERMRLVPEESRSQFLAVIDWLRERACARTRGLGTKLPWDERWIIESLSDSTIYMAFYTVIHKIRGYGIPPEKLTEEFWDYVMLGRGSPEELSRRLDVSEEVLKDLRSEFDYWYPLDSRHSGKDLIPSHLTFFIFNHVAIFPEDKWPKQIVANGWVLVEKEKMSKSKANILTLEGLVSTFSPDVTRLGIAIEAEVEADLNLQIRNLVAVASKLREIERLVRDLWSRELSDRFELPDRWLRSRMVRNLIDVINALENVRVRSAAVKVFHGMHQDLRKYLAMVEKPSKVVREYIELWVKLMVPFTPFLAEELWHEVLRKETLVVSEQWPKLGEEEIDYEAELIVRYSDKLIEDIKEIKELVGGERVVLYIYPQDGIPDVIEVREVIKAKGKLGDTIKTIIKRRSDLTPKEAVNYAKRLYEAVLNMDEEMLELLSKVGEFNEMEVLSKLKDYIEKSTGVKIEGVFRSDDSEAPDYGRKKDKALPLRPSIYMY